MSMVLSTPAAPAENARFHFLAKLSVETDVSDVWNDLQNGITDFQIIDARGENAYIDGHIPGALHLHHTQISEESTADTLDRSKLIVVYCWSPACNGAAKAAAKLTALGFQVKEMLGGIEYWIREGNPVERGIE